jgi:hypothetical protein
MAVDAVDVLDQLALHPERREAGMSRAELLVELDLGSEAAQEVSDVLGHLSRKGCVRKEGADKIARWFITTAGMNYQPDEDWAGNRWAAPAFEGDDHELPLAA